MCMWCVWGTYRGGYQVHTGVCIRYIQGVLDRYTTRGISMGWYVCTTRSLLATLPLSWGKAIRWRHRACLSLVGHYVNGLSPMRAMTTCDSSWSSLSHAIVIDWHDLYAQCYDLHLYHLSHCPCLMCYCCWHWAITNEIDTSSLTIWRWYTWLYISLHN